MLSLKMYPHHSSLRTLRPPHATWQFTRSTSLLTSVFTSSESWCRLIIDLESSLKLCRYLQHPNEKVARASHSVFVAFMSSGNDSDRDERLDLKEKLVFYYTQRSLEAYAGITPFEGLASGVAALVRHLPAGSPAIFYCINCLTQKAIDLCKEAISEDTDLWRTWEGSTETCKKLLDLLMRLVYLVDIQVLPYLLKQLAEIILQLPEDGQKVMLDELYAQVAESDDVTRKPVLVSWLQSLSYLCSQKVTSKNNPNGSISLSNTAVSLNGTNGQTLQSML